MSNGTVRTVRPVWLVVASLLSAFLLSEGALRIVLKEDSGSFYASRLKSLPREGGGWIHELAAHPYFGFVLDKRHVTHVNNFGFADKNKYPYRKKQKDELVVGVLGGSVAMLWTRWAQESGYFEKLLRASVPGLRDRPITVLNFSVGGYKQPQQFFTAAYFLESADIFLNIEGYNEVKTGETQGAFPIEYPFGEYMFIDRARGEVAGHRALIRLSRFNHLLLAGGTRWPLSHSKIYYLTVRALDSFVSRWSRSIASRVRERYESELADPRYSFYDASQGSPRFDEAIGVWEKYVKLETEILRKAGKGSIFVVQPNQYLRGSKPLSDWEKKFAIEGRDRSKVHKSIAYAMLSPAAERLRRSGVNIHDLTKIFSRETKTVYEDSCCHLNEYGHKLLADEIVKRMVQTLRF